MELKNIIFFWGILRGAPFLFMVSCISMKNNNSNFIFDENLSKNEYKKRLIEYVKQNGSLKGYSVGEEIDKNNFFQIVYIHD